MFRLITNLFFPQITSDSIELAGARLAMIIGATTSTLFNTLTLIFDDFSPRAIILVDVAIAAVAAIIGTLLLLKINKKQKSSLIDWNKPRAEAKRQLILNAQAIIIIVALFLLADFILADKLGLVLFYLLSAYMLGGQVSYNISATAFSMMRLFKKP